MAATPTPPNQAVTQIISESEAEILRLVRSLRFGSVEIQVHDSRIVQIERRERHRFEPPRPH